MAAMTAILTIGSTSASALTLNGTYGGESFGTFANVAAGQLSSQLGRSAYLPCPCIGTNNQVRTLIAEDVEAGDSGNVFRANVIKNTIQAGKAANGLSANLQHTSRVAGVNALNGLITADAIKAVANTHATSSVITSNSAGSYFSNLVIAGTPIAGNISPNTPAITLAGYGYVKLREVRQIPNGVFSGGISVNMIHIFITMTNPLDIPVGAEIIVAHARTKFTRVTPAVAVGGSAWAADAKSTLPLIVNQVGRIAPIYVPCQGTDGNILSNNVNITNVPGVITAGTAVTKAFGSVSATQALAWTSAKIENLNLLTGLVTADLIKAKSQSTFNTNTGGATVGSVSYVNLRIAGILQPVTVSPNTVVLVPLVGRVVLNEQERTVDSSQAKLKVVAVHLYITDPLNPFGLSVGTEIQISVARSLALEL
ncbi:MAG: hypothetical protein H0W07_04190 [Chloroflexi bacterium]|nr:hypothetical protein [Chloroflexota bacterium]